MTDDSKPEDLSPDEDPGHPSDPMGGSGAGDTGAPRERTEADPGAEPDEGPADDAGAVEPEDLGQPTASDTAPSPVTGAAVRGASRSDGGRASGTADGDEIPYVDDPISKWWVGLIIAVFVVIFAWAILFGRGGLLVGDQDEPATTPSPVATASASPSTASPSPSPSPGIGASPGAGSTPQVSASPQPEPIPVVTRVPGPVPTPAAESTPEVSTTSDPVPTSQPTPDPVPVVTRVPEPVPVVTRVPGPAPASTAEPSASPTG